MIIPFRKKSNRNLFSQVDILRLKYIHKLLNEGGLNRECEVYRIVENYPDVKSFLKTLVP
jgi:DNA-binding transcriptional MerR regulator